MLYLIKDHKHVVRTKVMSASPRTTAARSLDDLIERFQSPNHQRVALRRALQRRPHDPKLREALIALTTPREVMRAAVKGVFISYSRADELFALDLATSLDNVGISTWLDMLNVDPRMDWHEAIGAAIERCGLMLAIVSPQALHDAHILSERERFSDSGKVVLPVVAQRCHIAKLDPTWLDPVDLSRDFGQGIQQIKRMLGANIPLA
jgi:hypothetical protein